MDSPMRQNVDDLPASPLRRQRIQEMTISAFSYTSHPLPIPMLGNTHAHMPARQPSPVIKGWQSCTAVLAVCQALAGCAAYQPRPLDAGRSASAFETRSLREWGGGTAGWTLQKLTLAAFHFHPSLEEARAEVTAADAAIRTARQRPNPSTTFAPEYDFTKGSGLTPWIWGLSVEVPIETAGKRATRVLKAREDANSARCKLAAAAQKVRARVRLALVEVAAAEARVALLEEQRHIQEDLVKVLQDRVAVGETALTELTTYRLALNRAALDVAAARRDAGKTRAALATATGVPAQALAGVKLVYDLASAIVIESKARNTALRNHPEVLGALADYAAAEAALKLEIARQYPDVKLTNGFLSDQGDNKWQLPGFVMELPVLHHNQGPIAEAEAKRMVAAAKLKSVQARIIGEVDTAMASLKGAQAQAGEARVLLESELKAEDQAEKNIKAGGGDRLELLTAKVQSAAGRVSLIEAQTLAQQAAAALEEAVQPASVIEPFMKEALKPHEND